MFNVLLTALGIGFLIFIHEFGHFLAARAAGVRVEVFSLGFGQRLLGFVWRGTDYRLSLIPLGGYVRVAGEDPTQRTGLRPDDLYAKGLSARALFFSGGVLMNLLFALIAFPIVFKNGVDFVAPVIGEVRPDSPAASAGLRPGDRVLSVNGKEMYSYTNLQVEIALAGRRPVELVIDRDGEQSTLTAEPRYSDRMGLLELGFGPPSVDEPLRVDQVDEDSPEAKAGLRDGDLIVAIQGQRINGAPASALLFENAIDVGQAIALTVLRDGEEVDLEFVLATELSSNERIGIRPTKQRVVSIDRSSPQVKTLGIQLGDDVIAINGEGFVGGTLQPFADSGPLQLTIRRGSEILELPELVAATDQVALVRALVLGPGTIVVPSPGTPAEESGIQAEDRIVTIDDQRMTCWTDVRVAIQSAGSDEVRLGVRRGDENLEINLRPRQVPTTKLGFQVTLERLEDLYRVDTVGEAIKAGGVASIDLIKQLYVTLKRLFTGDVAAKNLGGIIQISRVSYHHAQGGWAVFLYFLALLSINLAFINVLPIPVLDGGHLMFLLIEKIKGSPVSAQVHNYSQILGLVFVIALMVFVTYNDILRLF